MLQIYGLTEMTETGHRNVRAFTAIFLKAEVAVSPSRDTYATGGCRTDAAAVTRLEAIGRVARLLV